MCDYFSSLLEENISVATPPPIASNRRRGDFYLFSKFTLGCLSLGSGFRRLLLDSYYFAPANHRALAYAALPYWLTLTSLLGDVLLYLLIRSNPRFPLL